MLVASAVAVGWVGCASPAPDGNDPAPPEIAATPVDEGPSILKPLHRLVDDGYVTGLPPGAASVWRPFGQDARAAEVGPAGGAGPWSATIDGDTRYVLPSATVHPLGMRRGLAVPADRKLLVRLPLDPKTVPGLWAGERALVKVELESDGSWEPLLTEVVTVTVRPQRRVLVVPVTIPAEVEVDEVNLRFTAQALLAGGPQVLESRPMEISPGAVLELSLGILEPTELQGPVRFQVEACPVDEGEGTGCLELFDEELDPSESPGWQNRREDLPEALARSVRLTFTATPLDPDAPFVLPAWGNPTIFVPAPRPKGVPNVILFSLDTLRADHLSPYGYSRETSPYLSRVAERGTLFEYCVAPATTTTASHMSLFTSLYPPAHGVQHRAILAPRIPTLAQHLRGAGVETAAITENGWLAIQHGFGRGFNRYLEDPDFESSEQMEETFAVAVDWLTRHRDKHFFLFLHTYHVHFPYNPGEAVAGLFADSPESGPHQDELDAYDREIRELDQALEGFVAELERLGLADDTLLIFTSDHGEEFLEHGQIGHGANLYQEVTGVPLIVLGPGVPAGRRLTGPVGLVDLAPTVLDAFGVEASVYQEGVSLRPIWESDAPGPFDRPHFTETLVRVALLEGRVQQPVTPPRRAVQVGKLKLMRLPDPAGARHELYDLAADPLEQDDLFDTHPKEAASLAAHLDGFEAHCAAARQSFRPAPPDSSSEPAETALSPEQEEMIRGLGYIE